ncbi:hypothetical protein Val02_55730 [Virgisporangium aliadipatigenens]|uniref:Uncharacterized protein n=1 Tax=Virgisporangium aliadipatigenens TaxID=741659 RepID=A0A8J4DU03_9ACTN|nr:hypothetical protein [Virgisporangium aliadipatigenens]GIJ48687.1 hypothetical protein Val02_55730 [Virgisporangium aliadipatigenens]
MLITSPATLLLAAVLASPTLWTAFVTQQVSYTDAALRYLFCVPAAAVMLWLLRTVVRSFGPSHPERRGTDKAPPPEESPAPTA